MCVAAICQISAGRLAGWTMAALAGLSGVVAWEGAAARSLSRTPPGEVEVAGAVRAWVADPVWALGRCGCYVELVAGPKLLL